MIGPLEKGIEAAAIATPPDGTYEGVDLRVLPKYISFRAAMLHNRLTQQYIILILAGVLLLHYGFSRVEVFSLNKKLREKEYILAPGVQDFTPAMPQNVPDSYIANAVSDFINQLGNVTSGNIDEQYASLSESMSPQLKVKFLAEASDWKLKVKTDGISELFTVTDKEVRADGNGLYQVTAMGRRDTYINNEYVGHTDEVVEMVLQLIPPKTGKRWYLQINTLSRQSADTFRTKKTF
ncbi:MAG: TraE/TraK family type IV conjugative transfer system protein [Bacteriovoracia bacterium]